MDELNLLAKKVDFTPFNKGQIVSVLMYEVENNADLMPAYSVIDVRLAGRTKPLSEILSIISEAFNEKYIDTKPDTARDIAVEYVDSIIDKLTQKIFREEKMQRVAANNLHMIFQTRELTLV